MRPVTQYEANDGSIWATEAEATKRDALLSAIADAMEPMGKKPSGPGFSDGHSYFQHKPESVLQTKRKLVAISRTVIPSWFEAHPNVNPDEINPFGIIDRIMSDTGGPLVAAWYRLMCVDSKSREWQQPYFVNCPIHRARPLNPEPTEETTP